MRDFWISQLNHHDHPFIADDHAALPFPEANVESILGYNANGTSLGHQVGSEFERAYQRSDLLDERRVLLEQWADFLTA